MCISKEQILNALANMSVIDVLELVSMIEKKFKVNYPVVNNNNNNNNLDNKIKEKSEFDFFLNSIGSNKIAVIKFVRSMLNLGLKEAKDLVESAPVLLKSNLNKNDSLAYKKSLEDIGASVLIK